MTSLEPVLYGKSLYANPLPFSRPPPDEMPRYHTQTLANDLGSRMDLRVGQNDDTAPSTVDGESALPPPLAADTEDAHLTRRSRLSRIFDVGVLRQATPEEQLATLRRLRAESVGATSPEPAAGPEGQERHHGARLAERSRERFRIRTRAQPPERQGV